MEPEEKGYINRHGLSRKVSFSEGIDVLINPNPWLVSTSSTRSRPVLNASRSTMWMSFSVTGSFYSSLSTIPRDLVQLQRFDPDTPIEETVGGCDASSTSQCGSPPVIPQMRALNDVVKDGYARYIGMSSCFAWQCESPYSPTRGMLIHLSQSAPCRVSECNLGSYMSF